MKKINSFLLLCLFPVFFVLHGMNENFGLLSVETLLYFFLRYLLVTILVVVVSRILFKQEEKSFLFSSLLLGVYFFFGAFIDLFRTIGLSRYLIILPLLTALVLLVFVFLKKANRGFSRLYKYLSVLLLVVVGVEILFLALNFINNKSSQQDFGDKDNTVYKTVVAGNKPSQTPDIYWLVIDEYSSSRVLRNYFNFDNPLDSILKKKGFFVADSAQANYNYTHFSLTSQLDMEYLKGFTNHSIVTPRDAIRGNFSLYKNNVSEILKEYNYQVENYTIYHLKGYPTKAIIPAFFEEGSLLNNQTLSGKLARDISWQLPLLFKEDNQKGIQERNQQLVEELDSGYRRYHNTLFQAIRDNNQNTAPVFLMAHLFDAHEPFIYNADGTLYTKEGLNSNPRERYIPQLQYSNKILAKLIDSIQINSRKDFIIVLQGDHGFKFEESDPLFENESCSTLFAVYYKNGNYSSWPNQLSLVNSFRILFNDKFGSRLPLLPDSSFNLYYRAKK